MPERLARHQYYFCNNILSVELNEVLFLLFISRIPESVDCSIAQFVNVLGGVNHPEN